MGIVIAIDAGTTGVRSFAVDEAGQIRGWSYREFTAALPRAGLGRARRRPRSGTRCRTTLGELCGRRSTSPSPPSASPTSARRSWPGTGAPGEPLHRAIVWQDRRTAARCDELAPPGTSPLVRDARPAWCSTRTSPATKLEWLLHRGRRRRRRRSRVRHRRLLAAVEPDRRGGARHRPVATRAARCSSTSARLAWSDELLRPVRRAPLVLPEVRPSSGRFGVTAAGLRRARRHPGRRHRGRPAGGAVRAGVLRARDDEEHLRHRLVRAHERRRRRARRPSTACSRRSRGSSADGTRRLRPRGRDLRHRRRGAVAARRPRPHRERGRDRTAGRVGVRTPTACSSSRPSPASAARGGTRTPRAPIVGITRGIAAPTSPAPSSSRWRTRPATSSRRWRGVRHADHARCGSTAAPR